MNKLKSIFFTTSLSEQDKTLNYTLNLENNVILSLNDTKPNLLHKPKILMIISHSLMRFFRKLQNIYFLLIFLINFSTSFDYVIAYFSLWLCSLLLFLLKDLFLRGKLLEYIDKEDNQTTQIYDHLTKSFIKIKWKDLTVGSLVLLKRKETSPADILILDTADTLNKEAISFIKNSFVTGETGLILRKACCLTRFGKCPSPKDPMKSPFSCKITFSLRNSCFSGYLRLRNDPKTEKLTQENLIEKGSILAKTDWLLGIVLFNGSDCRIIRDFKFFFYNRSRIEKISQFFFIFYCILSFIAQFFGEIMLQSNRIKFENNHLLIKSGFFNQKMNHLLSMLIIFPFELYPFLEILFFFAKWALEREFKKEGVSLNNPNMITELAHLDYVIMEKTGVLTQKKRALTMLYSAKTDSLYQIDDFERINAYLNEKQIKRTKTYKKTQNIKESPPILTFPNFIKDFFSFQIQASSLLQDDSLENFPPSIDKDPLFLQKDLLSFHKDQFSLENIHVKNQASLDNSPIIKEKNSLYSVFHTLLLSFLFCRRSKGFVSVKPRMKDEKLIKKLASILKYTFLESQKNENKLIYHFLIEKTCYSFEVIGLFEEIDLCPSKAFFAIIIKDPLTKQITLYFSALLSFYQRKPFLKGLFPDSVLEKLKKQGCLNPQTFSQRLLTNEESSSFEEKYHYLNSSLINQKDYIKELFEELLLKNLEFLGLLAFEEVLAEKTKDFTKYLKQLGVNTWLLSGDIKENVYSIAKRSNIIENSKEQILDCEDLEGLLGQMKLILNQLIVSKGFDRRTKSLNSPLLRISKKGEELMTVFEEKCENYLFINGKSLELILNNDYLLSHLSFLTEMVKTFIGYDISNEKKKKLVLFLKRRFFNEKTILTIGSGYQDLLMMQEADISVEIGGKLRSGDIIMKDIGDLKKIIEKSGVFFEKYWALVEFCHYKSLVFGGMVFVYIFFDNFSSNCFYDPIITLFYYGFFGNLLNIGYLMLFERIPMNFRKEFTELYQEARFWNKTREIFKRISLIFLEGGMIVGFISLNSIYNIKDYNELGLILCFSIMIFLGFKMVLDVSIRDRSRYKRVFIKGILIAIWLAIIGLFAMGLGLKGLERRDFNVNEESFRILANIQKGFVIFSNVLVGILINFLFKSMKNWFKFLFKSPFERLLIVSGWKLTKALVSTALKQFSVRKKKLKNILKNSFKNQKIIDFVIASIIGVYDQAELSQLNPITLFYKEKKLERKYQAHQKKHSIKYSKIFLFIFILAYSTYIIKNLINESENFSLIIAEIVVLVVTILGFCLMQTDYFNRVYYKAMYILIFSCLLFKILFDWSFIGYDLSISSVLIFLIVSIANHLKINFFYIFLFNLLFLFSYILRVLLFFEDIGNVLFLDYPDFSMQKLKLIRFSMTIAYIIGMCYVNFLCMTFSYYEEREIRYDFLSKNRIKEESRLVEDIFSMLVPRFIEKAMKKKDNFSTLNDKYKVSLLLCEIENFDELLTLEKENIMFSLDLLYRYFDDLCLSFGAQKIEICGKTYLTCTGLSFCESIFPLNLLKTDKTTRLLNMAFEMQKFVDKFRTINSLKIPLKIVIHEGEAVLGIIGLKKPQMMLLGEVVMRTKRVLAQTRPYCVTVTEEAMRSLDVLAYYFVKRQGLVGVYEVRRRGVVRKQIKLKKIAQKIIEKQRKIRRSNEIVRSIQRIKVNAIIERNSIMESSIRESMFKSRVNKKKNIRIKTANIKDFKFLMKRVFIRIYLKMKEYIDKIFFHYEGERKIAIKKREILQKDSNLYKKGVKSPNLSKKSPLYYQTMEEMKKSLTEEDSSRKISKRYEFLQQLGMKNQFLEKITLFSLFLLKLIKVFLLLSLLDFFWSPYFLIIEGIFFVSLGVILFFIREIYKNIAENRFYKIILVLLYFMGISMNFCEIFYSDIKEIYSFSLLHVVILHIIFTNICFIETLIQTSVLLIIWMVLLRIGDTLSVENITYSIIFMFLSLVKTYLKNQIFITSYYKLKKNEYKRKNQDIFVSNLLPLHVFEKMKQIQTIKRIDLHDSFDNVTLLFVRISNFDKIALELNPQQLINLMKDLFDSFDQICIGNQVYKVYCTGDRYVVMGIYNAFKRDPLKEARNIINIAIDMLKKTKEISKNVNIDLKIGIHTGNIIGGILGKDIVSYSIYGPDVWIASELAENGVIGEILISQDTKKLIDRRKMMNLKEYKDISFEFWERIITTYLIDNKSIYY